jgi:hypothetical protein
VRVGTVGAHRHDSGVKARPTSARAAERVASGAYLTKCITLLSPESVRSGSGTEDTMSDWGMPRRCVPMKDVAALR